MVKGGPRARAGYLGLLAEEQRCKRTQGAAGGLKFTSAPFATTDFPCERSGPTVEPNLISLAPLPSHPAVDGGKADHHKGRQSPPKDDGGEEPRF